MKKITSFFVTILIVLTGCAGAKESTKSDATKKEPEHVARTEQTIQSEGFAPEEESTVESISTAEYRDGMYTADGSYTVHDGEILEDIDFVFTIENDHVKKFELVGEATHPDSVYHQEDFMSTAAPQVIGAKLSELNIDVVAGSSATTKGFRKALADIKKQAVNEDHTS